MSRLFYILTRVPILIMLIEILIYLVILKTYYTAFKLSYYSSILFVVVVEHLVYFFIFQREVHRVEDSWSKMEIMRLRYSKNGISSSPVTISNLKVGDLVFLKGDSVSPADILVIDSSNQRHSDKIFHVSERRITGDNKIMTKFSVRNLSPTNNEASSPGSPTISHKLKSIPSNSDRVLRKMVGYIEYDSPHAFSDFGGSFKLKNDPKITRVTKENVLFCGTKLYTGWIIGMIIYTGFYTKIMQKNYNVNILSDSILKIKNSKVLQYCNRICSAMGYAGLLMALINIYIIILFSDMGKRLPYLFYQSSGNDLAFIGQLLLQLSYAFEMVPILIYALHDNVLFWSSFNTEGMLSAFWKSIKSRYKRMVQSLSIRWKKQGKRGSRTSSGNVRKSSMHPHAKKEMGIRNPRGRLNSKKMTSQQPLTTDPNLSSTPANSKKDKLLGFVNNPLRPSLTTIHKSINNKMTIIGSGEILKTQEIIVINFAALSELGCLDHVVFDKTDTLTTSSLEIMKLSTTARCYSLNCAKIVDKLLEIKTPGNNLVLNESQDEIINEREEYSEKSQEYMEELQGDFRREVCDEDSTWSAMIQGLEQPSYNLEIEGKSESSSTNQNDNNLGSHFHGNNSRKISPAALLGMDLGRRRESMLRSGVLGIEEDLNQQKSQRLVIPPTHKMDRQLSYIPSVMNSNMNIQPVEDDGSGKDDDSGSEIKLEFRANKEYPFDKFIRDIYLKREELEEFFSMVTLINRFTLEGEKNSKAQAMEDRAITDVLKNLGYSIAAAKKNKEAIIDTEYRVRCSHTNQTKDYIVIGVNFFSHNRDRLSVVFQEANQNNDEAYLLVKGSEKSMNSILYMKERDKNIYRELLASYKTAGLKQIIYGIKKLSYEEMLLYRNSYMEILKTSRDQMEGYENLAIDVEKGLRFYGCFGVRDNICPSAHNFSQKT